MLITNTVLLIRFVILSSTDKGFDMLVCPKDCKQCWDDLCRGSGCMRMDGYPMLEKCSSCGGFIDDEIMECSTCTCEDVEM